MSQRQLRNGLAGAVLLALALMTGWAHAQPPSAPQAVPPAPAAEHGAAPAPTEIDSASAASIAQTVEQLTQAQIQHSDQLDRIQQALEKQIEGLRPSRWDKWLSALAGLAGALLGATVAACSAYLLQKQRQQFEQTAARQTAGINELAQIKQFRSRQLNEFYGPLQALLQQGLVVRDELYRRMTVAPAAGVAFSNLPPRPGSQHQSLGIQHGTEPVVPFRLIDELPFIQQAYPQLMSNVGEMVRINSLVVALIHDKVGLVLHENSDLSQKLGVFLAHQSVLQEVHASVKGSGGSTVPAHGYSTTFPAGLQEAVDADCTKLRNELRQWEEQVTQWSQSKPNPVA